MLVVYTAIVSIDAKGDPDKFEASQEAFKDKLNNAMIRSLAHFGFGSIKTNVVNIQDNINTKNIIVNMDVPDERTIELVKVILQEIGKTVSDSLNDLGLGKVKVPNPNQIEFWRPRS
jgi:hypothetical protein